MSFNNQIWEIEEVLELSGLVSAEEKFAESTDSLLDDSRSLNCLTVCVYEVDDDDETNLFCIKEHNRVFIYASRSFSANFCSIIALSINF